MRGNQTNETRREKMRLLERRGEEEKTRRTLQFPSSSAFTVILPQFFPGIPLQSEGKRTTLIFTTTTSDAHN